MIVVDEIYSQRETLDVRAIAIHDKLLTRRKVRAPNFWIWGDCANPQDIMEINQAFARMKLDAQGYAIGEGEKKPVAHVGSPYRVTAVQAENKIIKVGVTRLENLISRGAFVVRRGIGALQVWMLGMNSARAGTPIEGSRLIWEIDNWQYPKTDDAKVQKDVPDDATADGADMMAATRYMVMSWWKAAPRSRIGRSLKTRKSLSGSGPERIASSPAKRDTSRPSWAGAKRASKDPAAECRGGSARVTMESDQWVRRGGNASWSWQARSRATSTIRAAGCVGTTSLQRRRSRHT
jgi:hypothetical protein